MRVLSTTIVKLRDRLLLMGSGGIELVKGMVVDHKIISFSWILA